LLYLRPNFNLSQTMKKIIVTLLLVAGFYSFTFAQNRKTEFGIDVGYNSGYVSVGQSGLNTDMVSGFNVGVSADHYFSDSWSLKVKALYDQKGWGNGYITSGKSEIDGVDFKLNYITVPVMANWHFGRERNWYVNFGPYIGFLLSANASEVGDVKNQFNTVDGGFAAGFGYKWPINDRSNFFIEYDGQAGLASIFRESDGYSYQNIRDSFNIGITF
jgi:hypothetical protein